LFYLRQRHHIRYNHRTPKKILLEVQSNFEKLDSVDT